MDSPDPLGGQTRMWSSGLAVSATSLPKVTDVVPVKPAYARPTVQDAEELTQTSKPPGLALSSTVLVVLGIAAVPAPVTLRGRLPSVTRSGWFVMRCSRIRTWFGS
jgi:hypothetical protein